MIEVKIPQDIRKYKTKIVGPFTGRNIVGLALALGCGGGVYYALKGSVSDVRMFAAMVCAIPGILLGWANFYAMPFEQFAKVAFTNTFLVPKRILYKTKNEFEEKPTTDKKAQKKKTQQFKSKNPEYKMYI